MKVCVTQAHITNGVKANSQHCMIADALKERCPRARYILVDLQSIRYTDPDTKKRHTYLTPPLAQQNLLRFDKGVAVKPFTFSLTNPQTRESGWKGQGRRDGASRKGRKRSAAHKKRYAYLAANRERGKQKEREFGLRKFAE